MEGMEACNRSESWNEFVGRMFDVDDTGHMVFKKTTP